MAIRPVDYEFHGELVDLISSLLDEDGKEVNNPRPLELPVKATTPESLRAKIQRILGQEVQRMNTMVGEETIQDARDFAIDDGFETGEMPITEHEIHPMIDEWPSGQRDQGLAENAQQQEETPQPDPAPGEDQTTSPSPETNSDPKPAEGPAT